MTRAVIGLSEDVTELMAVWAKKIGSAAYSKEIPLLAFRYKDWRVIVHSKEILILDLTTEDNAKEVMAYLNNLLD